MSQSIDSAYLGVIAHVKLSAQAARPDSDLRLLVGHSNLLDFLKPGLVENDVWSKEMQQRYHQRGNRGQSSFVEHFNEYLPDDHPAHEDEYLPDDHPSFEFVSDSDDDSDSSSNFSEDDDDDDDGRHNGPTMQDWKEEGEETADLSLLAEHLAYLAFFETQARSLDAWSVVGREHQGGLKKGERTIQRLTAIPRRVVVGPSDDDKSSISEEGIIDPDPDLVNVAAPPPPRNPGRCVIVKASTTTSLSRINVSPVSYL